MATVYLAIQENFQREIALKVMSSTLAADADFSERFLREARIVSRLVHPNIVTVHDVGIHQGHHYLSMEYIPGTDLKHNFMQLDGARILRLMKEVAAALDYAGKKGYVHRDVKPENIMISQEDGRAILMDFGIARVADSDNSMTKTGVALGTPYYMSPEQARGKAIDGRSDLYALGVVFYLLIMGKVPYDAESAIAIGNKQ
jgi:serine/threonine protein kinase